MSNLLEKVKGLPKAVKTAGLIGLCATVLVGSAFIFKEKEEPTTTRKYTVSEEKLANEVKEYLGEYLLIEDSDSQQITESAVDAYEKIVSSGVNTITDEHVRVLQDSIESVLNDCVTDEQISYEDKEALSSGIAQIILDTILERIENSQYASTARFEEEYTSLITSLQEQINELQQRSYQVNISTNIDKTNQETKLSEEDLQEIYDSVNKKIADSESTIYENIDSDMSEIKKEIIQEIKSEYGNIEDGKDGKDGKAGADGKDGNDGKTTYIAYADDTIGTGFSFTPTETSKYIGTCVSTSSKQPTDPALYSNWQVYRNHVITSVTDESGTTVYIN